MSRKCLTAGKESFFLSNEGRYLNSIQALRAVAFLAIFTYHCGITPGGPWGVSIFFVLSGFCMFYGYGEKNLPATVRDSFLFARNRIRRLYPLHIIFMIVVIIRECFEMGRFYFFVPRAIADALLVTSWFPDSLRIIPYNGVAWYLSTILFCYFMFSFVVKGIRRIDSKQKAVIVMAAIYVLQCLFTAILFKVGVSESLVHWVTYEWPLFRLGDFCIGCVLGRFYLLSCDTKTGKLASGIKEAAVLAAVLVSLLVYAMKRGILGSEAIRCTLLFTPTSVLVVYIFAKCEGCFTKLLTNQITVFLAKISAAGFVIHQVMIFQVKMLIDGGGEWRSFGERMLVFLISFVLTAGLALAYDRVFAKVKRRCVSREGQ